MNHVESSVKVYFTDDYGRFQNIDGNRPYDESKIKRIMRDIAGGLDVLRLFPIVVAERNGKLYIIDGQHRYFVACKTKSKVWYIISTSPLTLQQIAKINSNSEKWRNSDYINCYVQQDNAHYKTLQRFMDETGFPLSTSTSLLGKGLVNDGGSSSSSHIFREGLFKVRTEAEAWKIADAVKLFKDFDGYKSRGFIMAVCAILKAGKIEVPELVKKWERNKAMLEKQPTAKAYLTNLENIYNQYARQREVIW